jgi:hypothetical protein
MSAAAGLGSFAFTDNSLAAGTSIKGVHISDLRSALHEARNTIGLPVLVYVDGVINIGVTPVKAAHIVNLRQSSPPRLRYKTGDSPKVF